MVTFTAKKQTVLSDTSRIRNVREKMNKIFKKTTALFSAAVMSVCGSMGCFQTVFAEGGEGGKEVEVIVDRPLGTKHPKYKKTK